MIGIVNYGIGNLKSVTNALDQIGAHHCLVDQADELAKYDKLLLPGVGAFAACMGALRAAGFSEAVVQHVAQGKPLLGICVGMQMLATEGTEFGLCAGLGLIPGRVVEIDRTTSSVRLPQIGWNALRLKKPCPLFGGLGGDTSAYFVHSFHFVPDDASDIAADVEYGAAVTAAVSRGNLFGVQFHPEKSQMVGLKVLRNFAEIRC